jgi:hypothetical protein
MATYSEMQKRVRELNGFTPKTCHIAHVKSELNPGQRKAVNRINGNVRVYPCPPHKRPAILAALKYFGMAENSNE